MRPQRTLVAFVSVFVVAVLASAQPPAKEQKPAGGHPKAGAGTALGTPADEAAVRRLPEEYQQAYNANDAQKAASIYAENAVFVDVSGKVFESRAEIEKSMASGSNPASRPRLTLTTDAVRFIKPDVALMRGSSTVEGGNVPPGQGGGHWAVVAMKVAGQWKVVAATAAANPPPEGRGR